MTNTKLNLSALKKNSPSSNIENEVVDLVLDAEDIGHSNDVLEKKDTNFKEETIWESNNVIEISKNQPARDEVSLDIWLEEYHTNAITENDFIATSTTVEKTSQDNNNDKAKQINLESKEDTIEAPQEKEIPISSEEINTSPTPQKDLTKDINQCEDKSQAWEEKESSSKKKKTMLSLNSIKSKPKTDAEKKAEVKKALAKKNEDQAKRDKENGNITSTKHAETWEEWEEQELVSEDKKIVEEATRKIEKDLKTVDQTIASDQVQITLDKSLFDNYIPNYKGKKEAKAQKKEKSAKNKEKKKRIRGPINKKKRNLLIVAMFLCILGAWGFVLYPHVYNSSDLKSDVIQVTQDSVREKVDLVLDYEWWENEVTESEINNEITESDEVKMGDDVNTEEINIKDEKKDDKAKVKNYLLDNYYK